MPWLTVRMKSSADWLGDGQRTEESVEEREALPGRRLAGPAVRRSGMKERRGGRRAYDMIGWPLEVGMKELLRVLLGLLLGKRNRLQSQSG